MNRVHRRYCLPACLGVLLTAALTPAATARQFGEVQHARVSLVVPSRVQPGKPFDLTVRILIDSGFHIQSNKPAPNYIATTVQVTGPAGFQFGEPRFPPSEMVRAAGETIPVFSGTVNVVVPVTPPKKTTGRVTLKATVRYQACDEGSCYPPVEASAEAKVELTSAEPVNGSKSGQAAPKPADVPEPGAPGTTGGTSATEPEPEPPTTPTANSARVVEPRAMGPAVGTGGSPLPGYRMDKITQFVGPEEFERFLRGGAVPGGGAASGVSRLLAAGNLFLALPLIFLLGLALNLTPCVYPIIPITISYFGTQANQQGKKPFVLAVVYVIGMAVTYSALGVVAGLTGGLFGSQLQNPWVLLAFAVIMFALALSQFDRRDGRPIWEFQLPGFLRNRAQARSGVLGALAMGVMVGVVAAPCIGPAVIALLQWVGMQQSPALGFAVFLSLSLGLGLPYLFLAAASGSMQTLPRAGEWMIGVKHIFGAVLIWMGFYYLQTPAAIINGVLPKILMVGITAVLAIYLLFLDRSVTGVAGFAFFRRAVGVAAIFVAAWLALPAPREAIAWRPYSDAAVAQAVAEKRAILVDFTAAWCAACKELEHKTFSDPRVGSAARDYVTLRADMTNFQGSQARAWQKTYGISGLPTVVRLTPM